MFVDYNNFISEYDYLFQFYKKLELGEENLIIFLPSLLLAIFIIKFIFFSKMYFYQFKFINNLMVFFSSNLLNKYLRSSIEFHSNEDNSKLIRNIKDEVGIFSNGLIQQIIILFNEITIFLSVLILIFFVVTEQFIILFFSMIILSFTYYLFIKPIYHKYGHDHIYGKLAL